MLSEKSATKLKEIRTKIARIHGVSLEEYDSQAFQSALKQRRDEEWKARALDREIAKQDLCEMTQMHRRIGWSAVIAGIVSGVLTMMLILRNGDSCVKATMVAIASFIIVGIAYHSLVDELVFSSKPECLMDAKRCWDIRKRIFKSINIVSMYVVVIIGVLVIISARRPPQPCHPKCHWCAEAIENWKADACRD